jgi:hypothetical protein
MNELYGTNPYMATTHLFTSARGRRSIATTAMKKAPGLFRSRRSGVDVAFY